MADLLYIVMCEERSNFEYVSYQCGEPEYMRYKQGHSANVWTGGFTRNMAEAIFYDDYASAKKVRDRMAEIYSNFKLHIISKDAKEMFVERLTG